MTTDEQTGSQVVALDLTKIVTEAEGWDSSRAAEAAHCLRTIAEADGPGSWRARVCLRIAEQIEAQDGPVRAEAWAWARSGEDA